MRHDPPQDLQVTSASHWSAVNRNAEAGPSVPKSASTIDGIKKRKKKRKRVLFRVEDDSEVEETPNDDNAPAPNEEAEYVVDAILCATYRNFAPSRNKPGLAWHYTIQWHGYTQTQTSAEYPITADMFGEVGNFVAEFWAHAETPQARASSTNRKAHPSEPTGKKGECQMCPPQLLVKWYRSALRRYRDEKRKVDKLLRRGSGDERDKVIRKNLVWWIERTKIDLGEKTEECGRMGLSFLPDDSSADEALSERSESPPRKRIKKKKKREESPNNIENAAMEAKETKRLMLEKLKRKAAKRAGAVEGSTAEARGLDITDTEVEVKVEPSRKSIQITSPELTEESTQPDAAGGSEHRIPSSPPHQVSLDPMPTPLFMAENDEDEVDQPVKDHRPIWERAGEERAGEARVGEAVTDPVSAVPEPVQAPHVPSPKAVSVPTSSTPPPVLHVPQEPSQPVLVLRADPPICSTPAPSQSGSLMATPPVKSIIPSKHNDAAILPDKNLSDRQEEHIVKSSVSLRLPGSKKSWPLFDCVFHNLSGAARIHAIGSLLTSADGEGRPIEICQVLSQGAIEGIASQRSVIAHASVSASIAIDNKHLSRFIGELDRSQLGEGIALAQYQSGVGVLLYSTASHTALSLKTPPWVLSSHGLAAVFLRIDFGKNPTGSVESYQSAKSLLRHVAVPEIYPGTVLGGLGFTSSFLRALEGKRVTVMGSLVRDSVKAGLGLIGFGSNSQEGQPRAILLDEVALVSLSSAKNLRATVEAGTEFWLYGPSSAHQYPWGPHRVLDIAGGLIYISPCWFIEEDRRTRLEALLRLVEAFPGWYAYFQPQTMLLLDGKNGSPEDGLLDSLPELLYPLPVSQEDRLERLAACQSLNSARTVKQKIAAASVHMHIGLSAAELGVLMDSRESIYKKAQSLELVGLVDLRKRRNRPVKWKFPKSYVLATANSPAMSMEDIECVDENMLEKLLRCES